MFWNHTAEAKAAHSRTELMEAAMKGNVDDLRGLLADMTPDRITNTVDVNGASALFYAASHGQAECIGCLIAAGADPTSGNALVCIYGDVEEAYTREDDGEWDVDERDGFAPIHATVFGQHASALRSLIEGGADINQATKGDISLSPMGLAAEANSLEMVALLIELGGSVNVCELMSKQPTPLCAALASEASLDIIRALLDAGGDPNEQTWWVHGYTPMHMAARAGNRQALELMHSYGGRFDIACRRGYYPLHTSLEDQCEEPKMLDCQRYLCSLPSAPLESALWLAILTSNVPAIRILVSSGANVHAKIGFEESGLSPKLKAGTCALDMVNRLPCEWQDDLYYEENREWMIFMHASAVGRRYVEVVAMRARAIEDDRIGEELCENMLGSFSVLPADLIELISTYVYEPPLDEVPTAPVLPLHRRKMLYCMRDALYPWEIQDYETPSSEDEHAEYEELAEQYYPTNVA